MPCSRPLLQAALCKVPRRRLSAAEAAEGAGPLGIVACAICLNSWEAKDDVRVLKACQHVFHAKCVDGWLWRHQKCPMCRTPLGAAS
jgi:E3 ubiquitin-protein ligase ATL6/9/15/31/42/55